MRVLRSTSFWFSPPVRRWTVAKLDGDLRGASVALQSARQGFRCSTTLYGSRFNSAFPGNKSPYSFSRGLQLPPIMGGISPLALSKLPASKRCLHTSVPRPAPQFLLLLLGPVSRFMAAVGGRLTRSWWSRLPHERRAAIKDSIRKNARYFYAVLGVLSLFGLGYYAAHIEETPITRRRRFILFSRDQVLKMIESERTNILETVCNVDEQMLLPHTHPTYKRVQNIVSRILAGNNFPEFEGFNWALYVIDSAESVNALCLPTGDIFVYSGLVKQCKNDDELAFILSHEMAHAVLGHGVEALTRTGVLNFLQLFLIGLIWAVIPSDLLSYFMHSASRSSVQIMLEYPHSRKLETEADKV